MIRRKNGPRAWSPAVIAAGLFVVMSGTALSPAPAGAESSDTLVVFTQPGGSSEIAERFVATSKPALAELAESLGVAFKVVDVTEAGAPAEVGLTPLIVFQNHRGRSIYQGRTETPERVRNLVRTARFRPQQDAVLERPGVPFEKRGRMTLATPIKVTPLAGTLPADFDADTFTENATGWIRAAAAARGATVDVPARLGRSDRQFYLDFHPHRAADGTLWLGLAAFSQFHCHDPVFVQTDAPISAPWEDRAALFAGAYGLLMDRVDEVIAHSRLGDGFDPVGADAPAPTWEALGLALPPAPPDAAPPPVAIDRWPTDWVMVEPGPDEPPAVQFSFAAPQDAYRGEATRVSGTLTLGSSDDGDDGGGGVIGGATGRFVADPTSVTMGEADLDAEIQASMLDTAAFPDAFFVLETTDAEAIAPDFGVLTPAVLRGNFTSRATPCP